MTSLSRFIVWPERRRVLDGTARPPVGCLPSVWGDRRERGKNETTRVGGVVGCGCGMGIARRRTGADNRAEYYPQHEPRCTARCRWRHVIRDAGGRGAGRRQVV